MGIVATLVVVLQAASALIASYMQTNGLYFVRLRGVIGWTAFTALRIAGVTLLWLDSELSLRTQIYLIALPLQVWAAFMALWLYRRGAVYDNQWGNHALLSELSAFVAIITMAIPYWMDIKPVTDICGGKGGLCT